MWKYGRNTVIGIMGLSAAALVALPATAGGHGKHWHRHGKVKIVKKVVHVPVHHHWRRHHRRVVHRIVHYAPRTVIVHRTAPVRIVHRDYYTYDDGYYGGGGYGSHTLAGGVIGAAVGALAGNGIGSGSGRVAAIVGGAVLGAIVGGNIGQSMDRIDYVQTANVLETAPTGHTVAWRNPGSGIDYSVTPVRTYQLETGRYCREFQTRGVIHGREEQLYGTACRMPDGSWQLQG